MKKKLKVTYQEFAEELLKFRQVTSKNFHSRFMSYLNENEISINKEDLFLYQEIVFISIWTIFKALESNDKKDEEFLNIFLDREIEESKKSFETHKEQIGAMKYTRKMITDRFKKYFEAWDNESGGQQAILSIKMLECMGVPKEELLDFFLSSYVNSWILITMKEVLDFRRNFKIVSQ